MEFFVYILYSVDHDKYYIGQIKNYEKRIEHHNSRKTKSTKPYVPWRLKIVIKKASRVEAVILENKLKNLSKNRLKKFIEKYS